jgi:hypothetical protein
MMGSAFRVLWRARRTPTEDAWPYALMAAPSHLRRASKHRLIIRGRPCSAADLRLSLPAPPETQVNIEFVAITANIERWDRNPARRPHHLTASDVKQSLMKWTLNQETIQIALRQTRLTVGALVQRGEILATYAV